MSTLTPHKRAQAKGDIWTAYRIVVIALLLTTGDSFGHWLAWILVGLEVLTGILAASLLLWPDPLIRRNDRSDEVSR